MRIIYEPEPIAFGKRFPDAKAQFDVWLAVAERAQWKTPADIKAQYRGASILKGGRAVFNICGNKYRLIVRFDYKQGIGVVRFFDTHKAYDKINAEEV